MRRSIAVLALTVLVSAGLTAPPAAAAEYVTNGTFSSNGTTWNMPTGGGAAGVETCCANPPGGVPNAFFHPNGLGSGTGLNGYLVSWQNISGAPSGTYTLSARVRTSGGVQSSIIQADSGVFEGYLCRSPATNTTGWSTVSCQFNYTAGTTLHVAFGTSNLPATNGGWVAFDDVSLSGGGGGETPPYDLATYVIRTDNVSSPVHHMNTGENNQLQYSAGRYYQVKNEHWEEIWADANYLYRFRDTSDANTFYGLYRNNGAVQGDVWIARYVSPGYSLVRSPAIRVYNKSNCSAAPGWGTDSSRIVFKQYYAQWTSQAGVTLQNVIWLQSQHMSTAGVYNRWEDYYYAKGRGLVAFYGYDYNAPGSAPFFQGWIDSTSGSAPTREGVCTPA